MPVFLFRLSDHVHDINPKKAPGFDIINSKILNQLLKKEVVVVAYLINAVFRLKYISDI